MNTIKNIVFVIIFITTLPGILYGQNITGRYEGAVTRMGSVQLVNLDFYTDNGVQKATYEIPETGYYDVPVNDIHYSGDTLNIKFYY